MDVDNSDKSWERPITKVIGLLKDMGTQLQKEADEDAEMYEKMGCWCETNDKEKTKAIADAKRHIEALTASNEADTSKISQLETEIEKLGQEIAKSTSVLSEATALRNKENAQFESDKADMTASQTSLKGAVDALGQAHPSAASMMQIREVMKHHLEKHRKLFGERTVMSLLQEQNGYAPESGAIFGILKQMKEEFESNIASSSSEEAQALAEYNSMKKAKTDQMKASEELSSQKTIQLGDTKSQLANNKQDKKDTEAQLAADTKFLENVKDTCATADEDYEARQKVRTEEITAVGETIGILTDDEAQASFSKSVSFIQLSLRTHRMSSEEQKREKAVRMIRAAAMKSGDAQLSKLSSKVKLLDFSEIKKAIDDMMGELKTVQKEEVEKYEFCTSEIKANEKQNAAKTDLKADLEQKIADLSQTITTLTDEIAALKAEIAQTNVEMKAASETREAENKDFQVTVADQKATQAILTKASDRMKAFYAGLIQTAQTQPKQGTYKASAGGNNIINMLTGIINESKDVEGKALKAENRAQAAYEEYVSDSNAAVSAASDNVDSKTGALAQADKGKIQAKESRDATINDLLLLGEHNVALHQDCDFLIKNYDARQSARAEEIDSLFNAKAIFSGANLGFLQLHHF